MLPSNSVGLRPSRTASRAPGGGGWVTLVIGPRRCPRRISLSPRSDSLPAGRQRWGPSRACEGNPPFFAVPDDSGAVRTSDFEKVQRTERTLTLLTLDFFPQVCPERTARLGVFPSPELGS